MTHTLFFLLCLSALALCIVVIWLIDIRHEHDFTERVRDHIYVSEAKRLIVMSCLCGETQETVIDLLVEPRREYWNSSRNPIDS